MGLRHYIFYCRTLGNKKIKYANLMEIENLKKIVFGHTSKIWVLIYKIGPENDLFLRLLGKTAPPAIWN